MKNGVEELAGQLLLNIYLTSELKKVSLALETLSQSLSFKTHAREISSNSQLPDSLKMTQLLYLFKDIDVPVLYAFFTDLFSKHEFWMFASKQFNYFDEFVQAFELQIEKVTIANIVTAVDILSPDLMKMAKDLSEALGNHVVVHLQVNPGIVGGAQIRIGNMVFDYSLRSKFHQFQRQWISQMAKNSELIGREGYEE